MIHDAQVEVTCDGSGCLESVYVDLEFVYRSMASSSGYYDHSDKKVEESLKDGHGWMVSDGKHYCSKSCQRKAGDAA